MVTLKILIHELHNALADYQLESVILSIINLIFTFTNILVKQ